MAGKRDSQEAFLFSFYGSLSRFYSLCYNFRARLPKKDERTSKCHKSRERESFSFPFAQFYRFSAESENPISNEQNGKAFILISSRAENKTECDSLLFWIQRMFCGLRGFKNNLVRTKWWIHAALQKSFEKFHGV